jgi:hypothetical protein
MIITMSVMPPFTYPSLSLCNHGIITVLCDLQIFSCPTNEDVTRVRCTVMRVRWTVTLETGTSGALMTFGAIHHCLEASCAEVTFGTIYLRAESPPSDPTLPRPRLGQSSVM